MNWFIGYCIASWIIGAATCRWVTSRKLRATDSADFITAGAIVFMSPLVMFVLPFGGILWLLGRTVLLGKENRL